MNHTIEEYRSAIMKIFDEFYEMLKYYDKSWIQVITEENVPKEMLTGEIDVIDFHDRKMELKTWKYILSDISDKEIIELEKKLGITLPNPLKAYYTSYFHLFDFQRNLSANSPIRACSHKKSIKNHSEHSDGKKNNIEFIVESEDFSKAF